MITAAISAGIVGLLALLGVTLTGFQVAAVVVVVKIIVVVCVTWLGFGIAKRRKAAAVAPKAVSPGDARGDSA